MITEPALPPESLANLELGITSFQMRRVLSIVLALAFGLGPLAFAIGYDEGASLPACCRRHGAHHCVMDATPQSARETNASFNSPSRCPLFPGHQSATPSPISALVASPFSVALALGSEQTRTAEMTLRAEASLCTYTLRGPPATLISA